MKALRTIECKLSADGTPDVRVPLYAGVAGEHNSTELVFTGDAGMFASGEEAARISFCGGDGTVVSTDLLSVENNADGWCVSYALPSFLTVLGGQITARLVLSRMENGEETQTAISGGVILFLDDGGTENGTPFWTAVSQMLDGTVRAANEAQQWVSKAEDLFENVSNGGMLSLNGMFRYRGEASTKDIFGNTDSSVVGDVYYNTDLDVFYVQTQSGMTQGWMSLYKEQPYALTVSDKQETAMFAANENVFLSIPETVHLTLNGEPFCMYYRNVISKPNVRLWLGNTSGVTVKRYADHAAFIAESEGTFSVPWKVYDEAFRTLGSGAMQIVVTEDKAKQANVLVIGDSTVAQKNTDNQSYLVSRLRMLFATGQGNATMLGTRGESPAVHEGRSGWTAADYCTKASHGDIVNPFYNNGFDFAYYMSNQGYDGVDCVVIQLGINDIFLMTYESFSATSVIRYIQQMVNSVLQYDGTIRVIVDLLSVPNGNGTSFTDTYGTTQMDFVNLVNSIRMSAALIEAFKNKANVTVSSNNCVLNPEEDVLDGVHPTAAGYGKLAQAVYQTINGVYDRENGGEEGDGEVGGDEESGDTTVTSLWDLNSRTGVKRPDAGVQVSAAREMKTEHYYYLDAYTGICAASDKFTLDGYAATADTLEFTVNAANGVNAAELSAFGVSVPLALDVGKTYTFTCQAAGANMGVRLVTYTANGDSWMYEGNTPICYNSTDLCTHTVTPEAGKAYAIHFSQKSAGVGVKNVFTNLSLVKNG